MEKSTKVIIFLTFLLGFIESTAANIKVALSGLENSDQAIISIASYTYLSTQTVTTNGEFTFNDIPVGIHSVKVESMGYEASPSQSVIVNEDGSVSPSVTIKLALTKQYSNENEWTFKWEEDDSPSGYTTTSHVNQPHEIEFLGKKIVPADIPSSSILEKDYHIYLVDNEIPWSQEYSYRLLETLKMFPVNFSSRNYATFELTSSHIEDDIIVNDQGEGYEVIISSDAFYYANPFLVNLDGIRGRLFSKRLHHALTNFITNFGEDIYTANSILQSRFGCRILNVDYESLTKGITNEDANHFQQFLPNEIVNIINMLEELPEGFHTTSHLNYLIRRINGMPHPLYPSAAAVSWCVDNGYIEFMENAFNKDNEGASFDTLRLILHEKTHFLWAYMFSDEIKNDWIEVGGWYENPNASEGWSTTKDVEFVTQYAHEHTPNEDMAESVAFYLKNPDLLKSRSPEKYEFICNRIMHGIRYISKIPDHLTFEVLNLYPDYDYPGKIKSVNVTSTGAPDEDKTVTIEISLYDLEGYDDEASNALVRLYSPEFIMTDGSKGSQFKDLRMYPVNGDSHRLRGSTTISRYSKSGHWTAGDIRITDLAGNQRFEGQNDCLFDLFINNSLEDLTPPQYDGNLRYILTDTIIDGHNAQNLQVRFNASDDIGFKRILVRLQLPGSTYVQDYDGYYDSTTMEGIVNIPITEYFPEGDYYIPHISLTDLAGNNIWHTFSNSSTDYPIQYIHITTADPDTQTPEIDLDRITVYAEPTHPEAPDGETLVTISFYGRDDKSGLGKCNYRLRDPQGIDHFEYYYHRNFHSIYFDGDPTVWEHYQIKVILPKGSAPGIWGLAEMTVADKAYNQRTYNFVETLIFEPDDSDSDYELFSELVDLDNLVFNLSGEFFSAKWRVIHEDSGLEITGYSDGSISQYSTRSGDNANTNINVSSMPFGDLILIVYALNEDNEVLSVKSQRIAKNPISVSSIELISQSMEGISNKHNLKATETLKLKATVNPENASFKDIEWSVDKEDLIDLIPDVSGEYDILIKAHSGVKDEKVVITARSSDGITASYTISIDDLLFGDANDNGIVTVSDVITMANEILSSSLIGDSLNDNFCFINADIDCNGIIEVVDQAATVNIALGKPAFGVSNYINSRTADSSDYLVIEDFGIGDNIIGVSLENPERYVNLQVDFFIPEKMIVNNVTAGDQTSNHTLAYNMIDNNILRVILYSTNNSTFIANEGSLFNIYASVDPTVDNLEAYNIIATDVNANRYELESRGGSNNSRTFVNTLSKVEYNAVGEDGKIFVTGTKGSNVQIISLAGSLISSFVMENDCMTAHVLKGIYIVIVGGNSFKVIVR